jgi:hypothetical protein
MDQLRYLKGLVGNSPLQQIAISPSQNLLKIVEKDPQFLIYGTHEHGKLYHKLIELTDLSTYKAIIIDGADGQCLHIIGSIAMWIYRYNLGEKLPKLILIGEDDFKLPDYATFVRYPYDERSYDIQIITDIINSWQSIVKDAIPNLTKTGLAILVVPREKDFADFKRICSNIVPKDVNIITWPSKPSSKNKNLLIVHGEIDARDWYSNVEMIFDLGLESNMKLSSMGGEEEVIVISDSYRINRRELWLGYDRPGIHYRLFNQSEIPKRNKLPAERRRLYGLVNHLRNLTPDYHLLVPLIPHSRLKSTEKVLDQLKIDNFYIENLDYSPLAIKLIEEQWKKITDHNDSKQINRTLSAILIACIIDNPEKLLIRDNIRKYYKPDNVSPLINHFKIAKDYLQSGKTPDYCNQEHFQNLTQCMKHTAKIFEIEESNYQKLKMDEELLEDLTHIYSHKNMTFDTGYTYKDKSNKKWLVDMSMSSLLDPPKNITAIAWEIHKQNSIVYLWI